MRLSILKLLAIQVWNFKIKNATTICLIAVCNILLLIALILGYQNLIQQQKTATYYSKEVRQRWVDNPDKHPHRMAHYGYVALRHSFPLSFFDFGMDSYVGKVVFLEAHKQNTANFSEASLSNGLLRFGEITPAMILQLLLPLLIIFLGYDLVSKERENGTLKLLITQGLRWQEIILGKSIGLFNIILTVFIIPVLIGFVLIKINDSTLQKTTLYLRYFLLMLNYLIYIFILCIAVVWISAKSTKSKNSLIFLIGLWLLFTLIIPKASQVVSDEICPSPSKIEFETKIEEDIIKIGDSHNPNDPHFKLFKDSILNVYQVDSVKKLPFNYSGLLMREGEKLSSEIFQIHQNNLVKIFKKQQNVVKMLAMMNPYIAIKNISMALSGTDYNAFNDFQNQTETFRYHLAQKMNELQIQHISNHVKNSADPQAKISKKNWAELTDFHHTFLPLLTVIKNELFSLISLFLWMMGLFIGVIFFTKKIKAF